MRKYPKIASVTCNLQHQLECAAKTPPSGRQSERNICLWWNQKKCCCFGTVVMYLLALWGCEQSQWNILSILLFTFCSPLLILQQVMIIKGALLAPQSCKKKCTLISAGKQSQKWHYGFFLFLCAEAVVWKLHFIFSLSVISPCCYKSVLALVYGWSYMKFSLLCLPSLRT